MELSASGVYGTSGIYGTSGVYGVAKPQPIKESFLKDVIRFLRQLLGYCLCAVTCGCVPPPNRRKSGRGRVHETALSDTEREAVNSLLDYMELSKASRNRSIDDKRLHHLCILTFSDNVWLHRSAAFCFAEISEKMTLPLTPGIMEPLNALLRCRDPDVLRAATFAVSNFVLKRSDKNWNVIVESGSIPLLINLLSFSNYEVQCNVCRCIMTLAKDDENKADLIEAGVSKPLIKLCQSPDYNLQLNAVGVVLNLTDLIENCDELVTYGVIPILVDIQNSKDFDLQYYSTAALSNLSIMERHRTMMVAVGHYDVVRQLITLAQSPVEKMRCQACFVLRNLACDHDTQVIIIRYNALPALKEVLVESSGNTMTGVVACVWNLSAVKSNEVAIICESFLPELQRILLSSGNPEAQKHAAGTIRNLSTGDHARVLVNTGYIETLCTLVLRTRTHPTSLLLSVIIHSTSALATLADEEEVKYMILEFEKGQVISKLIDLANRASNLDLRYNCAGILGLIAVIAIPSHLIQANSASILSYITDFLHSNKNNFIQIALWTLKHLLDDQAFLKTVQRTPLPRRFLQVRAMAPTPEIHELAKNVIDKLIATDIDDSS